MNANKITISIIGFGNVGKCVLYQLLNEFQVDFCINVMEPNEDQYGSFLDISHASFLEKQHELIWNSEDLLADSQFILHCAGVNIPLNSDRLSLMEESKAITTAIFKDFKSNVNPIIIVIANPVFMSIPAVLTDEGAFSVSDFTCSSDELAALKVSARRLAGYCKF